MSERTTDENRLTLWMQMSVDGYASGPDGAFDWTLVGHDLQSMFVEELSKVGTFAYGRNNSSNLVRQVLWIFAASQLLALLLVLFAVIVKWLIIVGLIAFAVIALVYLLVDRR